MGAFVRFLGTGNAFLPNGRYHSNVIIDDMHIIDTPPTVLAGLRKYGISPSNIETIIFTHMHGDHIFGLPFLLLERKYISDRENLRPLQIICSTSARKVLEDLCKVAYPGSLDDFLTNVDFNHQEIGSFAGWSFERFPVKHNDAVDPFGYKFKHREGGVLMHSGDSGPCDSLYSRIEGDSLFVLEMGVPEWVPSEEHHKPSQVDEVSRKHPSTTFAITHTYVDNASEFEATVTTQQPEFGKNVFCSNDGDIWKYEGKWAKY